MAKLELLTPEQIKTIDETCGLEFNKHTRGRLDSAHGTLHHNNATILGDALAAKWELSNEERLALRVGLKLHDVIRTSGQEEANVKRDNEQSAIIAKGVLEDLNDSGRLLTSEDQRKAVQEAVARHGESPWREVREIGENFPSRARAILFTADKFEQIDPTPVGIRRSLFVSGKRMEDEKEGDLREFHFDPINPTARLKVFVYESIIRLTHVTPESIYPEDIQIALKPLFLRQRALVASVARAIGFETIEDIAQSILATRNEKGANLLQARGIKYPEKVEEYRSTIIKFSGLTDKLLKTPSSDGISSAKEIVLFFSSKWRNKNLEEVLRDWQPKGSYARKFKSQALDYVRGKWAENLAREILKAA